MPIRFEDSMMRGQAGEEGGDPLADLGPDHLAGRLLIAMPGMDDPRFAHAVILMCAHTPEHAMGVRVNLPVDGLSLADLLDRLGVKGHGTLSERMVLSGGPVERERGFVLHTDDYATAESTLLVGEGLALTATRDVLVAMATEAPRPHRAALALGCASWGAGQLDREMRDNVWLSCDADEAIVFDDDHGSKWARALGKIGVRAEQLSLQMGRA